MFMLVPIVKFRLIIFRTRVDFEQVLALVEVYIYPEVTIASIYCLYLGQAVLVHILDYLLLSH